MARNLSDVKIVASGAGRAAIAASSLVSLGAQRKEHLGLRYRRRGA